MNNGRESATGHENLRDLPTGVANCEKSVAFILHPCRLAVEQDAVKQARLDGRLNDMTMKMIWSNMNLN